MGDTDTDEGAPPQQQQQEEPSWAKRLRAELEADKAALAQEKQALATERRDMLFDKVGVPAEKVGKLFRDAYKGEETEDAIRAAAIEHGVLAAPQTTPTEERETLERINDALAGAQPGAAALSADLDSRVNDLIEKAESADEIDRILKAHGLYVYDA